MIVRMRFTASLMLVLCPFLSELCAQRTLLIALPDARITADQVVKGDCDTYGLGDWHCRFTASIQDSLLVLSGAISFTENANDYTTIAGEYRTALYVPELSSCAGCRLILHDHTGYVSGTNIGARGYQTFIGKGMIRRARILTDTFGCDAGKLGGVIQFRPVMLAIHCSYAGAPAREACITGF